ncbi:MAG: aspartate/glutamate racemase family protein [Gammaproteobacteria bacterium]|nr:aspartate/glutamate racemase family protein [Gammaproteobacteria bacterium]
MKTIGLIGGMSWESTALYYQLINQGIKREMGGLHSAKIVLVSVDFAEIESLQIAGEWSKAGQLLAQAAVSLQSAGADFFLICTNTMHIVAEQVQAAVRIPLLHIVDATGNLIKNKGFSRVGLLGTAFTMEQDFYKDRLVQKYGVDVLTPNQRERLIVHNVIYQELCSGIIKKESHDKYQNVIDSLRERDVDCVILGCTEIGLLVNRETSCIPILDTTQIHVDAALQECLMKS